MIINDSAVKGKSSVSNSNARVKFVSLFKITEERQVGDYSIKFYSDNLLDSLNGDLIKLAECYVKVFSESWGETWTIDDAIAKIKKDLEPTKTRTPIMSILLSL